MINPVFLPGESHGQSRLNAGSQRHQILISGTFSLSHLGKGLCIVIIIKNFEMGRLSWIAVWFLSVITCILIEEVQSGAWELHKGGHMKTERQIEWRGHKLMDACSPQKWEEARISLWSLPLKPPPHRWPCDTMILTQWYWFLNFWPQDL